MTRDRDFGFTRQPGVFARSLSFLLLAFIFYGTTVEAAHRHGRFRGNPTDQNCVSQTADETGFTSGTNGCADCLICTLQQDFCQEALAFSESPSATSQVRFDNLAPVNSSSVCNARYAGRAPPSTF